MRNTPYPFSKPAEEPAMEATEAKPDNHGAAPDTQAPTEPVKTEEKKKTFLEKYWWVLLLAVAAAAVYFFRNYKIVSKVAAAVTV